MATVLVTGSSRGIGLELSRQYRARGDTVLAVCREPTAALRELDVRVIGGVDVADDSGVATLPARLDGVTLDVLVNNAGILQSDRLDSIDYATMRRQFEVNTLGPLKVTRALLGCLADAAKVAIVSSRVGSIADNGSSNNYGYRASKAAVNMIGKNLSLDLAPRGIAVALLHPGLVATEMTGGNGIEPQAAAAGLIERIDELTLERTGTFWHAEGYELPW
ncbi:MAG: SDR family oxidoreductase [Pseudomonadota bacterium]